MEIDALRQRYQRLISPCADPQALLDAPGATAHPLDAKHPPSRTELRTRLGELFRRQPELETVVLTAGREVVGVVHRDTLGPSADPTSQVVAREIPDVGMLRATTDGTFEALRFSCPQPDCPEVRTLLFLDYGEPPLCRKDAEHGRLVRIRP